jgi:hypothetical protein
MPTLWSGVNSNQEKIVEGRSEMNQQLRSGPVLAVFRVIAGRPERGPRAQSDPDRVAGSGPGRQDRTDRTGPRVRPGPRTGPDRSGVRTAPR